MITTKNRNTRKAILSTILLGAIAISTSAGAGTITKSPDLGNYWQPLSATGSYVYADSFVADQNGAVTGLSTWLNGGPTDLFFEVLGSRSGNSALGPDSANVLAKTGIIAGQTYSSLTSVAGGPVTSFSSLIAGNTYWFAASTVGLSGTGSYIVGGHTQNSGGIVDNGTFWYSNDPAGINFDGQSVTPEMAFSVTISGSNNVPEPASLALMGLGLAGVAVARRRKK